MSHTEFKRINARIPEEMYNELDQIRIRKNLDTITAVVIQAIDLFLQHEKAVVCVCGHECPPGSRFCSHCGRALTRDAADEIDRAIQTARSSPEYQRLLRLLREEVDRR